MLVTTKEYRELLNDNETSDEQIQKRLEYLEAFCRNIIRQELEPKSLSQKNGQS